MQYKTLGRTGMKISRLGLGSVNFGLYTDEKEAFRIMDAAVDAGINFFDTANEYPGVGRRGQSEEIIGRWFAQGNGRREKTVLATKVYSLMEDINDGPNEGHGLSTYKIRRHFEASLRRLRTDHIELYQMHHVDKSVTWDELWDVFESLFYQGKVDYIGSSNFAGLHLMQAQTEAKRKNYLGLVSEQHRYNLLCRLPELEVFPTAEYLGIGILAYSPLARGTLAGNTMKSASGKTRRTETVLSDEKIKITQEQRDAYSKLCRELGESEANVAFAWILSNPGVTATITGPRTVEQFESLLRSVEIKLGDDVLSKLDEIFPGPGGPAPEAYAW